MWDYGLGVYLWEVPPMWGFPSELSFWDAQFYGHKSLQVLSYEVKHRQRHRRYSKSLDYG